MKFHVNNIKADQDLLYNTEMSCQLEIQAGLMNNQDKDNIYQDIKHQ